jgi:DNA-binding response OmpR family regulator
MIYQNHKLKLTEKEIDSIIYLFNMKKPVNVRELQQKVWGYQTDLETHTVETHIYRLRKKILKKFNDTEFIKSTDSGYQID